MPTATATRSGRKLPDIEEWHDKEKLGYEKEALGFLITGHPLDRYASDIRRLASAEIARLSDFPDNCEVRVCGIVTSLKEIVTKKGKEIKVQKVTDKRLSGEGERLGTAYKLKDGKVIYVPE